MRHIVSLRFGAALVALAGAACVPDLALKEDAVSATQGPSSSVTGGGGTTGTGGSVEVPYEPSPEVEAWLGENRGGWCNDVYNKFVNLCGDASFCFDSDLLKAYPNGFALDIGFSWTGLDGGVLATLGGDVGPGGVLRLSLAPDGTLSAQGPGNGAALEFKIAKRSHLVSYRVSASTRALFVDGVRVGSGVGEGVTPALAHGPNGGPGAVLGQAKSYWSNNSQKPDWLRFAPFFFHMRDSVGSTETFDLATVKNAQSSTLLLLHGAKTTDTSWQKIAGLHDGYIANGAKWVEDVDADCW